MVRPNDDYLHARKTSSQTFSLKIFQDFGRRTNCGLDIVI
jgi:hypothetical protein